MKQRIRVTKDGTVKAVRQHHPPHPSASLSVKMRSRRNVQRRRMKTALLWTTIAHLVGAFVLFHLIKPAAAPFDEVIHVEMVNEVLQERKVIKATPRQVKAIQHAEVHADNTSQAQVKVPVVLSASAGDLPPPLGESDTLHSPTLDIRTPETDSPVSSGARVPGKGQQREGYSRVHGIGRASGIGQRIEQGGGRQASEGLSLDEKALQSVEGSRVDDDKLGAVLEGTALHPKGHIRIVRLEHSLSDWWQDPTAIPSFAKWLRENTQLRADMTYAGGSLALTDDRILNAPMVIMTGHDKDIAVGRNLNKEAPLATGLNRAERAQLRKYIIERGGMLFFDDCGFNGNFAAIVQNELQRTLPEYPLRNIDHTHELYTVYYQLPRPPRGGDVFWGNLNKGDSGGYFPTESQFRFQKGITISRRLSVVFNRKDYLCSMETAEVGSRALLRMRRSNDVHRFMTNLLIYQMTYGGNTDRSNFKR